MAMAMLVSCFAISTGAMAAEIPTIKVGGESVPVTYPKNGSDEKSVKIAKFVPKQAENTRPARAAIATILSILRTISRLSAQPFKTLFTQARSLSPQ